MNKKLTISMWCHRFFLCVFTALFSSMATTVTAQTSQPTKSYIVKLKDYQVTTNAHIETSLRPGTTTQEMSSLETSVQDKASRVLSENFPNTTKKPEVKSVYIAPFRGFSVDLTQEQMIELKKDPAILEVFEKIQEKEIDRSLIQLEEQKQYENQIKINQTQSGVEKINPFATSRVAMPALDALDGKLDGYFSEKIRAVEFVEGELVFHESNRGKGVNIYVLTVGSVQPDHPDFGDRVTILCNEGISIRALPTYIAGVAAANGKKGIGVAPEANIISADVQCKSKDIFELISRHYLEKKLPSVVVATVSFSKNIDNGEQRAARFNAQLKTLIEKGMVVVTEAGSRREGFGVDPCSNNKNDKYATLLFPTEGITVGSTRLVSKPFTVSRSDKSLFGNCIDIFAPGEGVESVYTPNFKKLPYAAAPFVAGVAALILGDSTTKLSHNQVWGKIQSLAKKELSLNIGKNAPDLFLQAPGSCLTVGCATGGGNFRPPRLPSK